MKNSNIIQIALDWHKQEQRRKKAQLLNQVIELCKSKNIKWEADFPIEIRIGSNRFPCTESGLRRARDFVLGLRQKDLYM